MEKKPNNPETEGHVKEWQDRARVVVDSKESVQNTASANQSPDEDVEEKSEDLDINKEGQTSY